MGNLSSELAGLLDDAYRYALALTHNGSAAEDLVQEACVSVLRAGGPWQAGYVFAAVRHRYIDAVRSNDRRSASINGQLAEELRSRSSERSLAPDERARLGDTLHQALGRLGADEREVIYLHVVAGMSTRQIVGLTGEPRGTVLSRLQRGKRRLSEILTPMQSEAP